MRIIKICRSGGLAHLSEKDALFVPYIDAFIMHALVKKPIHDVPAYLKALNEKKVRMEFRVIRN